VTYFQASFNVKGLPKGQPRPRAFARKVGDKVMVRAYDAGTADGWKSVVVAAGQTQRPQEPLTGLISVAISFWLPRPKRLMRKKDPMRALYAPVKPDIDNLAKAVLDALTMDGWWLDDAQVVQLTLEKWYHAIGKAPGALVSVTSYGPLTSATTKAKASKA